MESNTPNIKNITLVYFLGIGGVGMSALARYFLSMGCRVIGYDKTSTTLTTQLEKEGAKIHYKENIDEIPETVKQREKNTLVVYTPAISESNKEFQFLKQKGVKYYKRSEVLGLISQNYFTIAIAGTHGKTTTSSMVTHLLSKSGIDIVAFLGGISIDFNSNFVLKKGAKVVVVEADEFDRSFLTLSPDIALITSLDADHLDIYGDKNNMIDSYQEFVKRIKKGGVLITKDEFLQVLNVNKEITYNSYSLDKQTDFAGNSIRVEEGSYFLDIITNLNDTNNVKIGLPGIHNVENAIGAFAIAEKIGVSSVKIKEALSEFRGVKRRFEYHVKTKDLVYIDDYAHHPTELELCIQSVKELYPSKKITGVFQPHLYSRTRDFADEFAKALSRLDQLILLDIYPARELPIEGVSSKLIFDKVKIKSKTMLPKGEFVEYISTNDFEVLLTLGAGDIDNFIPQVKYKLMDRILNTNE